MKTDKDPINELLSKASLDFATASIGLGLVGGMMKMFGLDNEKTPQQLAKEMMAGAIEGILNHFEYQIDNLKRQIESNQEELEAKDKEIEILKLELEKTNNKKK